MEHVGIWESTREAIRVAQGAAICFFSLLPHKIYILYTLVATGRKPFVYMVYRRLHLKKNIQDDFYFIVKNRKIIITFEYRDTPACCFLWFFQNACLTTIFAIVSGLHFACVCSAFALISGIKLFFRKVDPNSSQMLGCRCSLYFY